MRIGHLRSNRTSHRTDSTFLYGFHGGQCFDLIRLISASVTKYRVRGAVLRVAFVEL